MSLTRRTCIGGLASLMGAMRPALASAQTRPVLVFAAASLQTSLTAIARDWRDAAGRRVTLSFASSAALARQIDQGAPADIFASADSEWMDWAAQRKLIRPETRRNLLGNRLVLIARADNQTRMRIAPGFALVEALGDSRLAVGDPASVPAGRYAKAALTTLGVWDALARRLAGADNVRTALALVARGEARYGIVYETDVRAEPGVRIVDVFPAETHPAIVYPFALTTAATPYAGAFLDHLMSPAAARIFERDGFIVL